MELRSCFTYNWLSVNRSGGYTCKGMNLYNRIAHLSTHHWGIYSNNVFDKKSRIDSQGNMDNNNIQSCCYCFQASNNLMLAPKIYCKTIYKYISYIVEILCKIIINLKTELKSTILEFKFKYC